MLPVITIAVVGSVGACARADNATSPPSTQAQTPAQKVENILANLEPNSVGDEFQLALAGHIERLTADCMAKHDFQYQARDPRSLVDIVTDIDSASLDYAQKYGFGVTAIPVFDTTPDPTVAYVGSLSNERKEAFNAQFERCAESATNDARQQEGVTEAEQRFSKVDGLVRADAAYHTAEQEWARCATAAGYSQPTRVELINSFSTERDELVKQIPATPEGPEALPDKDPRFQDLQRRERAAAVATFPCSQTLDQVYRERYQALR
jgi:hypothetical protein